MSRAKMTLSSKAKGKEYMKKMQAGVMDAPGKIIVKDVEIEELKDSEILVKIDACGICGSDLNIFRKDPPIPGFWGGHEITGRVVEKGSKAGGPDIGKRVSVMPLISCGECETCKSGLENICSDFSFIGFNRPGGFAEYVAVPFNNVFELPEELDANIAVLVEPLACVVHSTSIAGDLKGKNVVVFGVGTIGLITILVAKLQGARSISAVGRYVHQRDIAKRFGAEMVFNSASPKLAQEIKAAIYKKVGVSADCVIETVGGFDATTITDSIDLLRPGGVIVLSGVHYDTPRMNLKNLTEKEIQVRGTQRYNRQDFSDAVELIGKSGIRVFDLSPIITHRVDLDDIARAYEIGFTKEAHRTIKVVVRP